MPTVSRSEAARAGKSRAKEALDLVTTLMAIPGKSGEEGGVAQFIQQQLRQVGVPDSAVRVDGANRRSPLGGDVGNVIVKLPGTKRAPRRLLMAHMDTVPLCVGAQPVRRKGLICSRDPQTALGGDNRAGVSVVLNAAMEILRQHLPHPPLTLFWPIQEEVGLLGARYASLSRLGNPKLCFNFDGGAPNSVVIGATGDYNIEIEIKGIASHAGVHPDQGVSAIAIASIAIAELVREGWHGLIVKGKNTGTSNIGVIAGGSATNVVTPNVTVRAEARSHDPRFRKRIVERIRQAFVRAAKQVETVDRKRGTVHCQADLKYESFCLSRREPVVQVALAAIRSVGLEPELSICNGGLDANWMTAHGFPTVSLGCGQQSIHTVDESLHVENYLEGCRVALQLATDCTDT